MSHLAEVNSVAEGHATRFVLLAFSASSGIAFYESEDGVRRTDIVTGQNELQSPGSDPSTKQLEFDLIPARLAFQSQRELMSFVEEEYLRDKKNIYYTILLTNKSLDDPTRLAMLKFLDNPGLTNIKITETLVPTLREIIDDSLAQKARELAEKTRLANVIDCFSTELSEVLLNSADQTRGATRDAADYYAKFIDTVRSRVRVTEPPRDLDSSMKSLKPASVGTIRGLRIKGEISSQEDVLVDDWVEGSIELLGGVLTIGRNGVVQANVKARRVVVFGKIRGDICATEAVDIRSSGSIQGDIQTPRISIEDGAYFEGGIDIVRPAEATKVSPSHEEKVLVAHPLFAPLRTGEKA